MNIDPSRRFTTWARNEVWTGPQGTGDFVPNQGDLIFDVPANAVYKVANVDYTTGLSQWERFVFTTLNGASETDVLIGIGPGADSETWRVHTSLRTVPFEARFDLRLVVYGAEASYLKVFKIADFNDPGAVISGMYDQNDNWVSDNVPITGTGMFRTVPQFYFKESVTNGQPLYVMVYNAAGTAISEYRFLAHVTDYIPSGNVAVKHITNITLETKFLSESVTDLVQIPKNMPLSSLVLHGRVHYSDGTSTTYSVDGTKFTLLNIQPFVAGIEGQRIPVRLKYSLGSDESGDGVIDNVGDRFITRLYTFEVMPTDHSYSVKLMNYLDWDTNNSRYNMISYLYAMDRLESFNVSNITVFGVTGDPFTGVAGSGLRSHVISVDLEEIDPGYEDFRYIQVLEAEILSSGNSSSLRWRIKNEPDGDFYDVLEAEVSDSGLNWGITLTADQATLSDWLEELYYKQGPLFIASEIEPLAPTHFRVVFAEQTLQLPINQWNSIITYPKGLVDMTTGRLLIVEFVRIEGGDTFVLGAGGMTVTRI